MIRPELTEFAEPIGNLKPHPQNVRQGDIGAISQSLKQHGQYRPIVVQRSTGFILAGNHTYKAALSLKWKQIATTYVDCDDEQALRILLIDNRANDLATYDDSALVDMLKGLMDTELKLDGTGFDPDDLDQLLRDLDMATGNPIEGDPDDVPDDAPSKTVPGDVWLLGDHRLMCGDSTLSTDIERLMAGKKAHIVVTDPPWNVNYGADLQKDNPQGYKPRTIMNDHMTDDKWQDFVTGFISQIKASVHAGAIIYLVMSAQEWPVIDRTLRSHNFHWSSTIIWAKDRLVLSRKDYHTQYEPIWYGWSDDGSRLHPLQDRKQSDLWNIERPSRSELHPTTKPIELIVKMLNNSSSTSDIVLDAFGGSGSTLIAAHQTGRVAYLMELDPKYCDVICKRFQQATGITPIAEATGNEHSFIE